MIAKRFIDFYPELTQLKSLKNVYDLSLNLEP